MDWFRRLGGQDAIELFEHMVQREQGEEELGASELVQWLSRSWRVVAATLEQWTVDDLGWTFEHEYAGKIYAVSRQWVIWRIMAHDIHHGGQLSELLAAQGEFPAELTWLGGHLTEPTVLRDA